MDSRVSGGGWRRRLWSRSGPPLAAALVAGARGLDRVDRVVVLIAGQVRAVGTHEELVAQGGWYAERWRAEQERGDLAALIEGIPAGTAPVR